MTVETEYFDRGSEASRKFTQEHNQSANTHWRFSCVPKFKFDIVDKNLERQPVTVTLKISSINVVLSAPVVVYLPKLAQPEVISHEDGHVKICRKVYDSDASSAALTASEQLIGKEFTGSGESLETACQSALHHAAQEIGRSYRARTTDLLDRVSTYYDQISPQHPQIQMVDACVEAAFKADKEVTNRDAPSVSGADE